MRINELDLIAYGKFSEFKLDFPKGAHDFHVIVGPNEAGKSTVRRAITELLFGMERLSPLGFKHPQSDLRVGGVLATSGDALTFIRSKQQRSLRSPQGDALPENFLSPVLGSLTKETFESLHCMNHERLVKGGQGIVDPNNSVSQILFQAASGVEGFAEIRDALASRAGQLFATRGSNNEYSLAVSRYANAQKTLKEVQVRTKEWVQARDLLDSTTESLESEKRDRRALEVRRRTWERVRRLSPRIKNLARLYEELRVLGETITFPSNAKKTLEAGMAEMDKATGVVRARESDVIERQLALSELNVEERLLEFASEIERLSQLSGRFANHSRDLPLRRNEVENWLVEILSKATDFGWGNSEAAVRKLLPSEKLLREIDGLLKTRGELFADARAAADTLLERQTVIDDLENQLADATVVAFDASLSDALSKALPFKSSIAKQKELQGSLTFAEGTASRALITLGRVAIDEATLRTMPLPSVAWVTKHPSARQDMVQAANLVRTLVSQTAEEVATLKLQLEQFGRSHKVITRADVSSARRERDEKWNAIKAKSHLLSDIAPQLDIALRFADELSDARTSSEADVASMQGLRDRLEASTEALRRHEQVIASKQRELQVFDKAWAEEAAKLGLNGLALDDLPDWLTKHKEALQASDAVRGKAHELDQEQQLEQHARNELTDALRNAGLQFEMKASLGVLCSMAEEHIKSLERTRTVRSALEKQLRDAQAGLKLAAKGKTLKDALVDDWTRSWVSAKAAANLISTSDNPVDIEGAVEVGRFIQQQLVKIESHRTDRIETMERDLAELRDVATLLATALAPGTDVSAVGDFSRALTSRLDEAKRQSHRRTEAQEFLDGANRQLAEARSVYKQAKSTLEPLLKISGVSEPMAAISLVEQSLAKQRLELEIENTRSSLENEADGLTLEQVQEEATSHLATDAAAEILSLEDKLQDSERELTLLAQAQLAAKQAFEAIDGSDKAASAAAQKQEALADMAEACEEYLQIATASSLLKWAVDKYRDRKQGPLLVRASTIFRTITSASFEKLRIDYDQSPPTLLAYRASNQAVKVAGLSNGTRDQLFLALRIAALELQTEQGSPIPFIADDLFINFDDERSEAGLRALYELSAKTQVLFLSHQEHLLPIVKRLFPRVNVISLTREDATTSA